MSHDSKTAWVTLQENNALAIIDLKEEGDSLVGLGFKDHSGRRRAWTAAAMTAAIKISTGRYSACTSRTRSRPSDRGHDLPGDGQRRRRA